MSRLDELQHAMVRAGFFPEKKYSQNFLVDEQSAIDLVAAATLNAKDRVLEIGAGTGFVTEIIAQKSAHVYAVELRPELCNVLREKFSGNNKVEIVERDFLGLDLKSLDFSKIIAAPPYAISDDIMYLVFERGFTHACFIWQFEFADKILSCPGSSEYHPLSVIAQYQYDGRIVRKITPKSFFPVPNHFSAILSLKAKKKRPTIENFPVFVSWLKTLFRFKNKTVSNASKQLEKNPVKGISREKFARAIKELDIADEKVFLLEPEDFVELYALAKE
jgi:16S rRNA (adenine1518-N6/adenine1519-N6)-dimethyltransferase